MKDENKVVDNLFDKASEKSNQNLGIIEATGGRLSMQQ